MNERLKLCIGTQAVGSLLRSDLDFVKNIEGVQIQTDAVGISLPLANVALDTIARRFLVAKRLKAWRNELLAVCELPQNLCVPGFRLNQLPLELAQVERGAARVLGILTHAVHLVGTHSSGAVWVQQRALNKATDPGLWDTLAGGLLAAGDGLDSGVLRETHEEAGLLPEQLEGLQRCGMSIQSRVVADGHILEAVWTFRAQLSEGVEPRNLDGEVMGFKTVALSELRDMASSGLLTHEAALSLQAAGCLP